MSPPRERRPLRAVAWLILAAAVTAPLSSGSVPATPPAAAEIERLIQQLGSPKFAEREAASKALDLIGEPALTALEKAVTASNDAEVRRRAKQLHTAIHGRTYGEVRRLEAHAGPVHCAAFPDGRRVLSGHDDGSVRLWDLATGKQLRALRGPVDAVWGVAVSPDGKQALTGGKECFLRLWDLDSGQEVRRLAGHADWVLQVAFSSDGRQAVSGSHDKTMRLWDVASGRELRRFGGHRGTVYCAALSPDGRHAASGSSDNLVRLWSVTTGVELRQLAGHSASIWAVAFSPDGKRLLSGSADGTLRLWEVATGKPLGHFPGPTPVNRVAFTPDGRRVLSASGWEGGDVKQPVSREPAVRLWDVASGKELHCFWGHAKAVCDVAVSPDGRSAFSASKDGTVRLWRLPQ